MRYSILAQHVRRITKAMLTVYKEERDYTVSTIHLRNAAGKDAWDEFLTGFLVRE
jgi:hypothetical protein